MSKCYDIHFWHGLEATSDEMGSAAALAVQLSENLPIQSRHHLELQNEETDLFMSYWKTCKYLPGGCESGFKHVEPKFVEPRLLLVKGKKYPRVHQVPMTADQVNEGDCFILDMGETIYYWIGLESNYYERLKALEIAVGIRRDERKDKAVLHYPRDMGGQIEEDFWSHLGGRPA
jgi:gelsolin